MCCDYFCIKKLPQNLVTNTDHEIYGSAIWTGHNGDSFVTGLSAGRPEACNLVSSKGSFTYLSGGGCWLLVDPAASANIPRRGDHAEAHYLTDLVLKSGSITSSVLCGQSRYLVLSICLVLTRRSTKITLQEN